MVKAYANGILFDGTYYVPSTGNISRTVEGYGDGNDKWAFIASPVEGSIAPTEVDNLVATTATEYDLYQLNPSTVVWENYKAHEGNAHPNFNLVNGQGYLYATKGTKTLVFPGIYNTGTEKVIEDLPQGFNLVGNPFIVDAYVSKPYYTLNDDGSAILTTTSEDAIAPCHGVIVELDGNESVTFSTTPFPQQSMGNNGNIQVTLAQTVATRGGAEAKTIDNAIVTFNEGMELGKFYFGTQDANVYIPQDGKDYAVAYSSGVGEVPVNFKANRNGEYSLTINPEGVEMAYLHLIDNLTGNDVDLLQTPSYTFNARYDDYASRFRLVFVSNDAHLGGEGSDDFAFISNGELIVTGIDGNSMLQIIDLTGRVLASFKATNRIGTSGLVAGVYVLRIINGDDVKTQKIVIK